MYRSRICLRYCRSKKLFSPYFTCSEINSDFKSQKTLSLLKAISGFCDIPKEAEHRLIHCAKKISKVHINAF